MTRARSPSGGGGDRTGPAVGPGARKRRRPATGKSASSPKGGRIALIDADGTVICPDLALVRDPATGAIVGWRVD